MLRLLTPVLPQQENDLLVVGALLRLPAQLQASQAPLSAAAPFCTRKLSTLPAFQACLCVELESDQGSGTGELFGEQTTRAHLVSSPGVCSYQEQELHELDSAPPRRFVQGRVPLFGALVDVCPDVKQSLCGLHASTAGCLVKRGPPCVALRPADQSVAADLVGAVLHCCHIWSARRGHGGGILGIRKL